MANLRVFVSSTYYDLHHVRNDLFNFLSSMGYEAVMHERGGVTYGQDVPLEQSCYDELSLCDIVVCVIGNKYGTKSDVGDFSITLEELQKAIKAKKKVYTFIVKDVFIENGTYERNITKGSFEPAYVDNIKIHEFIANFKRTVKNNPILPFESVDEIIRNLKLQFSGLFQKLLSQESVATEQKTYYDLHEISMQISEQVKLFDEQRNLFFTKFDGSIYAANRAITKIRESLGLTLSALFIPNRQALIQFMEEMYFYLDESFESYLLEEELVFTRLEQNRKEIVKVSESLFHEDGKIKDVRTAAEADKLVSYTQEWITNPNDELPF